MQVRVGLEERTLHLVPPVQGTGPFPILVVFHGRGGNGEAAAQRFAIERAVRSPFVGLYPDGRPQPWMHGAIGWDSREEGSPDLEFFDAMVEWARATVGGDPGRVHVLGYSWGGGMANHVACTRPTRVRSVVSVGGGGPSVPCGSGVSALVVHGVNDQEEPIAAGHDTYAAWAFAADCGPGEQPALGGNCVAREGCGDGSQVLFCEHPRGHEWPSFLKGPALGEFLGL